MPGARGGRAARLRASRSDVAVGRREAAARDRVGAGAAPVGHRARRADHRSRSRGQGGSLRADQKAARARLEPDRNRARVRGAARRRSDNRSARGRNRRGRSACRSVRAHRAAHGDAACVRRGSVTRSSCSESTRNRKASSRLTTRSCAAYPRLVATPADNARSTSNRERRARLPHSSGPAFIGIENVSFSYAGGPRVLDSIDLKVEAGEFLAIVGQNGSGKTTLAKHIVGLLQPATGPRDDRRQGPRADASGRDGARSRVRFPESGPSDFRRHGRR